MNGHMSSYNDFLRYLTSKVTVDDRALNKDVWQALVRALGPWRERPLRVLEVGAGVGTMAQRLWRWRLHPHILYTGLDLHPQHITYGLQYLKTWARGQSVSTLTTSHGLSLSSPHQHMGITLLPADALAWVQHPEQQASWDLLIAHALLDLLDLSTALPLLLATLRPGGLGYFTLNFDGMTLFQPEIDEAFEAHLMALYHRSMDERQVGGKPAGESRTGRHLFHHLQAQGVQVLAMGASDWVVFPKNQTYPHDEAYFLHAIIHTIHQELTGHPQVDQTRLEAWVRTRHRQIETGQLVYIAHQLDYLVRK